MLRVAIPNKGSLSEPASRLMREAGYRQRSDSKELVLVDDANDVEFFFLRPRDIAVYVGTGTVDIGITGRDLLIDSGTEANELLELGLAASTFRFAAPSGTISSIGEIAGCTVATSYEGLVNGYLADKGIEANVVHLDGAVESSIRLGIADVIADVVETGSTLRAAGLDVFGEPILTSEAVLFERAGSAFDDAKTQAVSRLIRRIKSVIVAREYVLMDYDIPAELVEKAVDVTPGFESPTVSPLHDGRWCAVRSMVPQGQTNQVMDVLYDIGARAILITSIHACRI